MILPVGQVGLKLLVSSDSPASASQSAGIIGMSHQTFNSCTSSPMLFISGFVINSSHSDSVRCYLIAISICISLMISGVENLSVFLLAFSVSSLEKWLLKALACFESGFVIVSSKSFLYIKLANTSFHSMG